jgi:hypothetical protein
MMTDACHNGETIMATYPILAAARRQARMLFVGIAIPQQPTLATGVYGPIRSEKVLKFNRTALKNAGHVKSEKVDSRYRGGDDNMVVPVGKPGSAERIEALAAQYAALADRELSPFGGE